MILNVNNNDKVHYCCHSMLKDVSQGRHFSFFRGAKPKLSRLNRPEYTPGRIIPGVKAA